MANRKWVNAIPKISGIYKITNNLNNKFYIGKSVNIGQRWTAHIGNSTQVWKKEHLYASIRKYGIHNFTFEVLEEHPTVGLLARERELIKELQPDYNVQHKTKEVNNEVN